MSTFDLTKEVEDINGNPVMDGGEYLMPNQPQDVQIKASGETIEDVSVMIKGAKPLTYRKAIQQALLADVNPQQNPDMPDKHDRSMLALKLVADKDVDFTSDNISLIKKSAKHSPQTSTVVYMRLVELLDPAEAGITSDDNEGMKRKED